MDRRSFIRGIVAAPAIVAAASLMPINARLLVPRLVGDGIADDTDALQYLLNSGGVIDLQGKVCRVTQKLVVAASNLRVPYMNLKLDHGSTALYFHSATNNEIGELIMERVNPSHGYVIEFKS